MNDAPLHDRFDQIVAGLADLATIGVRGRIADVSGLAVDVVGLSNHLSIGDLVDLRSRSGVSIPAEIVGFRNGHAQAMTYASAEGLGPGATVHARLLGSGNTLAVADSWIGRIIDPLGRPLDRRG